MSEHFDRRQLVEALVGISPDALFVSGLGSPSWDLAACGDSDRHFYLWGGMGQTVMVAMGLALAQPERRVLAITGDGDMLMGVGTLATVGSNAPCNLGILVLDNETYGETGGQASATRGEVDLVAAARAFGIKDATILHDSLELQQLVRANGPIFRLAKVSRQPAPLVVPPRDGAFLKTRLREALDLD